MFNVRRNVRCWTLMLTRFNERTIVIRRDFIFIYEVRLAPWVLGPAMGSGTSRSWSVAGSGAWEGRLAMSDSDGESAYCTLRFAVTITPVFNVVLISRCSCWLSQNWNALYIAPSGLFVIGGDTTNLVGLGGCTSNNFISEDLSYYCQTGQLRNPTMWLGIFLGGWDKPFIWNHFLVRFYRILTVLLMLYRVRGAILIGIFLVSIISWPRPTAVTYFPYTEAGDVLFDYFKQVVTFHPLTKVGNVIDVR